MGDSGTQNQGHDVLAARDRRRAKILKEILDTEKTYQNHLRLVVKHFEGPLREQALLPDHIVVTIFSNVRQIISINEELLSNLETMGVGRAFQLMAPFLKLYSMYANNHERALASLIEWDQKNADFASWRRSQEDLPDMEGLKLNALLITPVQRVPRYKLLLEDLLQHTDPDHSDYAGIQEAVKQVSEVAHHINEHIKQQDNFMKMLAIQRSLHGPATPRILVPGRLFIKEGMLKKVSKKGGRSYVRQFFLFSDILMYCKPKLLENGRGSYTCCCILPLQHCRVDRLFGHSQGSGALFTITCKEESLLLYSDQVTVESWISTMKFSISKWQAHRQTLKKPSSAKQPLRRPALVRLRKQEKNTDPLARRTPEKSSPRRLRRALAESNVNCLSPCYVFMKRKRKIHSIFKLTKDNQVGQGDVAIQKQDSHVTSSQAMEAKSDPLKRVKSPTISFRDRIKQSKSEVARRLTRSQSRLKSRSSGGSSSSDGEPCCLSPSKKKKHHHLSIQDISAPIQSLFAKSQNAQQVLSVVSLDNVSAEDTSAQVWKRRDSHASSGPSETCTIHESGPDFHSSSDEQENKEYVTVDVHDVHVDYTGASSANQDTVNVSSSESENYSESMESPNCDDCSVSTDEDYVLDEQDEPFRPAGDESSDDDEEGEPIHQTSLDEKLLEDVSSMSSETWQDLTSYDVMGKVQRRNLSVIREEKKVCSASSSSSTLYHEFQSNLSAMDLYNRCVSSPRQPASRPDSPCTPRSGTSLTHRLHTALESVSSSTQEFLNSPAKDQLYSQGCNVQ